MTNASILDPAIALAQLRQEYRTGARPKFLYFWGHRTPADGSVRASCFSQWYPASFDVGGVRYPTAEHFMMAEKARLFGDADAYERILRAKEPGAAKAIGRGIRDFVEEIWIERRFNIVVAANVAKFSQNQALGAFLIRTGEQILVEASPIDSIWGIGLAADSPEACDPGRWQGMNLLGFCVDGSPPSACFWPMFTQVARLLYNKNRFVV